MKTKDLKLDGFNYKVDEFKATSRLLLQFKFANHSSKFYGNIFTNSRARNDFEELSDEEKTKEIERVNSASQTEIFKFFSTLDPEAGVDLVKSLIIESVSIPPFKAQEDNGLFDKHFKEHFHHLIPLAVEAYKLNYGKFIEELKKKFKPIGSIFPSFSLADMKEEK
jgi:hypothetical protein